MALHKRQPWPIHANVTVWMTKSCLRDHGASDLLTIGTSGLLIFGIFWRSGSLRYVAPDGATGRAGLRPYVHLRILGYRQQAVACRIQRVENTWCLRNDVGESIALPVGSNGLQGSRGSHRKSHLRICSCRNRCPLAILSAKIIRLRQI